MSDRNIAAAQLGRPGTCCHSMAAAEQVACLQGDLTTLPGI